MAEDNQSGSNNSATSERVSKPQDDWVAQDWEELNSDPSDKEDLGYEIEDWEQFETIDNTDQTIFLPSDESQIEDSAFVVVDDGIIRDLEECC